ncbi:MAG: Linear gramicidin synthase subunit D [Syntrophorhabdus sp. PtaU1.Bin153]|nr:MAG: Linear gramicidin synthase subunit D [Syntrophorhabdus sp. PtaU1.Bin153]
MAGKKIVMRASPQAIEEKRRTRGSAILVTGGTGLIGSHLVAKLCRTGYRVIAIARPNKQMTGQERINRLLDWFGLDSPARSRIEILEGHLDDPDLGLDSTRYRQLAEDIDEIVHCASDTSFSERKRAQVEKANVANLENVLELASRSTCCFFHHISTAYAAGKNGGRPCKEDLVETGAFTNVYEETKHRAEWIATKRCASEGIRLNIYRPSIVHGDSKTGRTIRFNALYYPIRTILFFKNLYEKDIVTNSGRNAEKMGVYIDRDGIIHLPIRVKVAAFGGINLIPVDYFVEAFMAIMEDCLEGGIFHIVNTRTRPIEEIIDYVRRLFRVAGIRVVPCEDRANLPRNGLEVLFDHYIRVYEPYIRDTRIFENSRAEAILKKRNIACPEFDYDAFSKCMQYAVDVDWGTRL